MRPLLVAACFLAHALTVAAQDEGWIVHTVEISPDLRTVVLGRFHNERGISRIIIRDAKRNEILHEVPGPGVIRAIAWSPDSKQFVVSDDRDPLQIYDAETGKLVRKIGDAYDWVGGIAWSPDGKSIACASGKVIELWSLDSGKSLWKKEVEEQPRELVFSPNGRFLACAHYGGLISVLIPATGVVFRELEGHWRTCTALDFSANGGTLLSAGGDGTIHRWNVVTRSKGRPLWIGGSFYDAVLSPDGKLAAWSGKDTFGMASETTFKSGKPPHTMPALRFSSDGKWLVTARYEGETSFRLVSEQDIDKRVADLKALLRLASLLTKVPSSEIVLDAKGRIDIYSLVRAGSLSEKDAVDLFRSRRTRVGPTAEEIKTGDYSRFRYERFKGNIKAGENVPLLWDKLPALSGERLVAYANRKALVTGPKEFEALLRKHGQEVPK